jgi:gamma-glutamylaminecyclotransferase
MTREVFVYGTLLRGECNHRLLARARFVGEAVTEARFELVDLGAYPAMCAGGTMAVRGECYCVDARTLARLDRLEGHPDYYERVEIRLATGREVETYVMPRSEVAGRPRIGSGDWRRRGRGG